MTFKEANELKIGDFVRVINTHKDKKSNNDTAVWIVVDKVRNGRERCPMLKVTLRLVCGEYVYYDEGEKEIQKGGTIIRTSRALKKLDVVSIEVKDS